MTTIYERIKNRRLELGMSQEDLAIKMGYKSRSTINKIESGSVDIARNKIEKFATVLKMAPVELMGWSNNLEDDSPSEIKAVKIPVLGTVVAGIPVEAIENVIDWEEISINMAKNGEYFALEVKGSSMEPQFYEGDRIIVRKQSDVDSGDIAIVLVNGDDATVKEVKKDRNGITLIGYNVTAYSPTFYSNKDIETLPVTFAGKVVESRRKF